MVWRLRTSPCSVLYFSTASSRARAGFMPRVPRRRSFRSEGAASGRCPRSRQFLHEPVQRALTGVAEGRVAEVVREARGFDEVGIDEYVIIQRGARCAGNRRSPGRFAIPPGCASAACGRSRIRRSGRPGSCPAVAGMPRCEGCGRDRSGTACGIRRHAALKIGRLVVEVAVKRVHHPVGARSVRPAWGLASGFLRSGPGQPVPSSTGPSFFAFHFSASIPCAEKTERFGDRKIEDFAERLIGTCHPCVLLFFCHPFFCPQSPLRRPGGMRAAHSLSAFADVPGR